ncbi:MAG: Carbon monoxide dehydrogenase large chain [Alphaproteobacteria bacterium MarineAlpha11_Bin1]|nr:MAG: Carbon monoxide dehydrogenase large chain [Alphaproteobacteria bacterium MarineAlpha11_Bin1]|tara:strand:- start:23283 stop:25634 length:2352 start_codon:yes stop_codon:yes gene_type:complete
MDLSNYEPPSLGNLVGTPVSRIEDGDLLRGAATFLEDLNITGQMHAVFVRSELACADIIHIDTEAALQTVGVLSILTGADLEADGIGGVPWEVRPVVEKTDIDEPVEQGDPSIARPEPAMPARKTEYVGQILAMVIADTRNHALDAAGKVHVSYREIEPVIDVETAVSGNAPTVDPAFPDNICFTVEIGDKDATDAVFERAAHVVRIRHVQNRGVGAPIETRGYIGDWDSEAEKFTLYATAGKPHPVRNTLAKFCFFCEPENIRVLVPRLGGGFGAKNIVYAEEVLVLWAARRLGVPVRWISERSESFISDVHTRDMVSAAEYALDEEYRIKALRVKNLASLGAYLGPRAGNPVRNSIKIAPSVYDVPVGYMEASGVLTNTVPTCPIRGAGEPEGQFTPERLMDEAARQLSVDRFELRRRNLIRPDCLPYRTISQLEYDCGDFGANFERALELSDRLGYEERQTHSVNQGKLRGFALCNTIEALGFGLDEEADIRCSPDGSVELRIGSMSNGQGHDTIYAQIIAGKLGLQMSSVKVIQGDTDDIAYGTGTGACRSIIVGGSAVVCTTERVIEAGLDTAAGILEAAKEDIEFTEGSYSVKGTDRTVTFPVVVEKSGGINACDRFMPNDFTYPNGAHCCEVELDPETGTVEVDRYIMVHDCGTPVNPSLVEGQLHGGVVHGLGQAFTEHVVYDPTSGQVMSGSFLDYGLPRADDVPVSTFVCELRPIPTRTNPLGAKAVGEAGVAISPIVAVNAVLDALRPLGVSDISMPMTPARIRGAIDMANG